MQCLQALDGGVNVEGDDRGHGGWQPVDRGRDVVCAVGVQHPEGQLVGAAWEHDGDLRPVVGDHLPGQLHRCMSEPAIRTVVKL